MEDRPKFPGIVTAVGNRTFIIPPLNFRQLREYGPMLVKISQSKDKTATDRFADLSDIVPMVHAAISRNYPDVTEEEVSDLVDLGNYTAILEAIMAVSGIKDEVTRRHAAVVPGESRPPMARSAS